MSEVDCIEIEARLRLSADHLSGELRTSDGWRHSFSGWLGLIGALESARQVRSGDNHVIRYVRLEGQP
jgi:hypothetical protein